MADHIENEGKKGRFVGWAIVYFLLLVILLIAVYQLNFKNLPGSM